MLNDLWTDERISFKRIADDAPTAMWLTLPSGFCFYLNRAWTDLTGQNADDGLGAGWLEMVHPDDQMFAYNSWFAACSTGSPYQVTYRLRHADGQYRSVTDAAMPHYGRVGDLELYVGVIAVAVDRVSIKPKSAKVLSPREREVLRYSASGKTASEVADLMGIMDRTANFYMGNIMRKLGASNRVHAVVQAIKTGEIEI